MGSPLPLFDAHLHPDGLSDQDLATLRAFGVEAAVALAHHTAPEATSKALLGQFDALLGTHLPRLERAGIRAYAALGVHPQRVPRRGLGEVLAALPGYFRGGKVVALGETGLHRGGELEEECFVEHLALARRLSLRVVVHTPALRKDTLTRRCLALIRAAKVSPGQVLVDHARPSTLKGVLECGHWAGLTLHPDALSGEEAVACVREFGAVRLILNSDAGDGASDIVGLARAAHLMAKAKLSPHVVRLVTARNAGAFFRVSEA